MPTGSSLNWSQVRTALGDRGIVLIGRPQEELRGLSLLIEEHLGKSLHVIPNEHWSADDAPKGSIPLGYTSATGIFHALHSVLTDPPSHIRTQLDSFDPHRRALVIADSNVVARTLDGRPVLDARSPELALLEYPGEALQVWEKAGLVPSPAREIPSPFNDLLQACAEVDLGYGVMCFGDRRLPLQEALESARIVHGPAGAMRASEWLHLTSERALVQAIVPGTPVATSGMVIGDYVLALRPVEEGLVFDGHSGELGHAACSTLTLAGQDEVTLRGAVQRVGTVLREHHSFQGAFSVGGWLRRGAFTPSRLVTRTTRTHRHAIGAGVGAGWSVVNALAAGRVLRDSEIVGTGFPAHATRSERRGLTLGLVTRTSPSKRVVGKWLTTTPDGDIRESRVRTGSCLLWVSTQDGGIITGLGLDVLFHGAEYHDKLMEILALVAAWWPSAGLSGLSLVGDRFSH